MVIFIAAPAFIINVIFLFLFAKFLFKKCGNSLFINFNLDKVASCAYETFRSLHSKVFISFFNGLFLPLYCYYFSLKFISEKK